MKTIIQLRGRHWFLRLVALILMAGCAPAPGAASETALPITATPDPLYTLHCIRQSGRHDFCYSGELLIANNELLEKAALNLCNNKPVQSYGWCLIHIWRDENSVPQSIPLTETEKASRIATFTRNPTKGGDCFQAYNNGEIVYSSSSCD
jgi:hypothetical protein